MTGKLEKAVTTVLGWLNPEKSTGRTLMVLNALGIGFAAASNTFAAATDKNTSAEDKKFLVPAGAVTGLANLGIYFGMTSKLVDYLENNVANKVADKMIKDKTYENGAKVFIGNKLSKAAKGGNKNLYNSMKKTFLNSDGALSDAAKFKYTKSISKGLGVVGAFIGAVVGCAIITPVLRDLSAYAVQKLREKNNPSLQNKPYSPYFDPTHIGPKYAKLNKQPLSMTSYMNFTHGRTRV